MTPNPTRSRPFLLLLFAAAFCAAAAEPIHVPISLGRRGSPTVEDLRRYGPNLPIKRRATVPIGDEVPLYYLTLSIGTPAQQFRFEVDLQSPYSWVGDTSCTSTTGCKDSSNLYDPSSSSTVTQMSTGNITFFQYLSVDVSGTFMKDTVRLGPYTVPSQFFLAADKLSVDLLGATISGALGLAYQQTVQGPSFPISLLSDSKGQLASAEMSFWISRPNKTIINEETIVGGAFTYGGTNTDLYQGEIDFLPTTGPPNASSWKLDVQEVIIQGKSVQITSGASALATFSLVESRISGPASDVAAIWAAFPEAVPYTSLAGYYQFPCNITVSVSISFGGRLWLINPADMNTGPVAADPSQCLGAIYTLNPGSNTINTDGTANWIFGTAFMRNVYSVFQPNPFAIGFAELSIQAQTNVFTPSASTRPPPLGAIVGSVVGSVVVVGLLVVCTVRRRKAARVYSESKPTPPPGLAADLGSQNIEVTEMSSPSSLTVPQVEFVPPSAGSSVPVPVACQPQPQSPTRTALSTMKAEQTSAVHHYGAMYTASNVLLSPGYQGLDRSYSLWASPTHAVDEIQEVYGVPYSLTSPTSITSDTPHNEDAHVNADLGTPPPRYQNTYDLA
ncbi:aspartic peptidase domain-containing protein [Mycena olivaceomarginata]|nr:aspartic peptidase domain-containing protein [Mycena olivaceomarginata]